MKPFVRDKDAIQALILIAELAAYYKEQGKTTYDGLQELFEEHGYFEEKTISNLSRFKCFLHITNIKLGKTYIKIVTKLNV